MADKKLLAQNIYETVLRIEKYLLNNLGESRNGECLNSRMARFEKKVHTIMDHLELKDEDDGL